MASPPIADRDAAPLLPSTPGRPRDTNRCRVHRHGRGRWRAPEVAARRCFTFAMPIEQRSDGEAVPEVVHARPVTIAGAPQPNLSGQAPEDAMDILVQQATALLGDEE